MKDGKVREHLQSNLHLSLLKLVADLEPEACGSKKF